MAMCARKSLMKRLRQRRKIFYGKKGNFSEQLKTSVDQRMVIVHDQQEQRKQYLHRFREANRNMAISR